MRFVIRVCDCFLFVSCCARGCYVLVCVVCLRLKPVIEVCVFCSLCCVCLSCRVFA